MGKPPLALLHTSSIRISELSNMCKRMRMIYIDIAIFPVICAIVGKCAIICA
jgi:hypothetical protein